MSKTTKIIAALGVVAGLGVAALPAFTYAADPASTTGNVEVDVEVLPAIAMTITGNNDNSAKYTPDPEYVAVSNPAGSPTAQGWFERSGSGTEQDPYTYTASSDTEINDQKTYYQTVFHATDNFSASGTIDIHTTPATAIVGTSSSYAQLLPNSVFIGNGDASNGFRSTITVYTNANSGYNLTLNDSDATNALTQIVEAGETPETIPAINNATSFTAGTKAWGYKVASRHGSAASDTDWLAVPVAGAQAAAISTFDTKTTNGDQTIVDYGVATSADQATGIYTDTIIYTATTK